MHRLIPIAALALLAGCGNKALTAPQTVYGVESGYLGTLAIEVAYKQLPVCGTGPVLCREPAMVARIIAADTIVHDALSNAQNIVRAGGMPAVIAAAVKAAQDALADLQSLTAQVKTK